MFTRPYNLACLLAIILGGAAAARAVAVAPPTVKGNVSIQLPAGWTVNSDGRTLLAALAPRPDKDASGQFQASLSVSQNAGNKIDGAAQQTALARQMPGYQPLERPTPVTIGGLEGVSFGGTFKNGNVSLRTRQYMFTRNNLIYTITFTSLNSTWAGYQAIVQSSVGTFTVK